MFNSVYVRLITYVLSLAVGAVPAWAAGWLKIDITDGWVNGHMQIEGAVTALLTATGITGTVFKKFGTK